MPGDNRDPVACEQVKQVAAGKSRGTGDKNETRHENGNGYRVKPPNPPCAKGETVPMPARVNEIRNVLFCENVPPE